jgi:hypothetical protein
MKNVLIGLVFAFIASGAAASSFVNTALEIKNGFHQNQTQQACDSSAITQESNKTLQIASNNFGQCMGACASEQGICISQCQGNGQCISNCAAAHGRCVSRCN